ncbi:hypothetical protein EDE08_10187 [Bradyrhizobium sp. R2.2-H]|jgi:hypothetical protein|uniref:hypothetical protein n=1 Tax=unclassified Bradyrhizobium TaxID=2631580 RepID=UPI00104F4102|nr:MULTISPECIES: hypothetical protein [unclassified Bradyrhizobium]TCU78308.1 hypothetical protein EDE10_10187 [Bradyrhizobium sp. Y-H1]TCU80392.1 hypothetical protein EDE08_10187 [Bradyrhizobium sp. R2.2-H]
MADADLDVVIRQLARQLHTGLMTRAKERRDRFNGLAAKAKGKETGERFKMMAKATMEQATAAAKRLQMSADNVADSYARSMRLAASTPIAVKVEKKAKDKPEKKAKTKKAKARKAK